MTDKTNLKDILSSHFDIFIADFADPATVQVEVKGLSSILDTQKKADQAKKEFDKNGFKQILALYFDNFKADNSVDYIKLEKCITSNEKVLLRHLSKDKVMYIRLIVDLHKALEAKPRKRGLLGVA